MYETIKWKLQLISQKMESQKTLNYLIQKKEKREKDKLPKRQSLQQKEPERNERRKVKEKKNQHPM